MHNKSPLRFRRIMARAFVSGFHVREATYFSRNGESRGARSSISITWKIPVYPVARYSSYFGVESVKGTSLTVRVAPHSLENFLDFARRGAAQRKGPRRIISRKRSPFRAVYLRRARTRKIRVPESPSPGPPDSLQPPPE